MRSPKTTWVTLGVLAAVAVGAEEPARNEPTPYQVEVVVARKQGGRDVSRLPYLLTCNADEQLTSLRLGIEVPVPVGGEKKIQYRNVGTNIDCRMRSVPGGRFRVQIQFEQSSLPDIGPGRAPRKAAVEAAGVDADAPLFRTFNSSFVAYLRDGQTGLQTAATDPVSGEEVTIEVTLKALK